MTATVDVFAYGSLMIPRVMQAVTSRTPASDAAVLRGYARYALRGETYPGLVEDPRSATDGMLWRSVDDDSMTRIERFEGDWYERRTVQVHIEDDEIPAETFVLRDAQRHRVSRRRWIQSRFEQRYLQRFLVDCGLSTSTSESH